MSLQDQLDAYRVGYEAQAPAEALAVMHSATAGLVASALADRIVQPGAPAPAFELPDASGAIVSSTDLLARGPLVVSFYRGIWCPFCNLDLKALQAALPTIQAAGATLVTISPQNVQNGRKTIADLGLSFPVLSDAGNAVAAQFGLRYRLPDDLATLYETFGVNLPLINGDPSWTLPMPARFVIGRDGVVLYAEASADYTKRPDPEVLLPALRAAAAQAA